MTSTPALVEAVTDAARRHDTGIHIHLAEHLREVEHCVVNYRMRPAEWLDSLNLLGGTSWLRTVSYYRIAKCNCW